MNIVDYLRERNKTLRLGCGIWGVP